MKLRNSRLSFRSRISAESTRLSHSDPSPIRIVVLELHLNVIALSLLQGLSNP